MRRHAIQESQLVQPDSQGQQHFDIQPLGVAVEMTPQQEIQKPLPAQHAHREFSRQSGVAAAYAAR